MYGIKIYSAGALFRECSYSTNLDFTKDLVPEGYLLSSNARKSTVFGRGRRKKSSSTYIVLDKWRMKKGDLRVRELKEYKGQTKSFSPKYH